MKNFIRKEEKQILINFDTKLYPTECIVKAAQDFSESCWTGMGGNPNKLQIVLMPKSKEVNLDTLGYEFYNYVLGIIKNERKVKDIERRFGNGILSK